MSSAGTDWHIDARAIACADVAVTSQLAEAGADVSDEVVDGIGAVVEGLGEALSG